MEYKELERLTKVEVQLEQISAVVLKMDAKLDKFAATKVDREELLLQLKLRDQRLQTLEAELTEIRKEREQEKQDAAQNRNTSKATLPSWVAAVIALAALAVAWYQGTK